MPSTGNEKLISFFLFFFCIICTNSICLGQTYYYCCSYEEPVWGTNILFSKIDLDSKTIVDSISIPLEGEIQFKKPIVFERPNRKYFFISTFNGLSGKNTELLSESVTNYSIIDESGKIIYSEYIPGIQFFKSIILPNGAIMVKFMNDLTGHMKGILNLSNNHRISIEQIQEDPFIEEDYPEISGFRYFKKIKYTNDRLYWNTTFHGEYLLSIDIQNDTLIDSLNIETERQYSNLFGLSDNDSLVYVFYMNSNYLGHPEEMQKLEIDPSYVKIFNAQGFSLVDSIDIEYPPLDSGYVGRETGSIDKVGPYFVYFYFSGEDYRYFSPAMLFIFDTRTNEANWLRVGWR